MIHLPDVRVQPNLVDLGRQDYRHPVMYLSRDIVRVCGQDGAGADLVLIPVPALPEPGEGIGVERVYLPHIFVPPSTLLRRTLGVTVRSEILLAPPQTANIRGKIVADLAARDDTFDGDLRQRR